MKFDKISVGMIRAELDAALAEVAKRHGLKIKIGNIKFSDDKFDAPLSVTNLLDADDPLAAFPPEYVAEGKRWSHTLHLVGQQMRRVIDNGMMTITVIGVKPRTGGKQIIYTLNDGQNKMYRINYIDLQSEFVATSDEGAKKTKLVITKTN